MNKLKAKLNKQGGFTMVELLIVVAIIAILVAVSIPTMNAVLERSRHAVDQANQRDAMGLALAKYVAESGDPDFWPTTGDPEVTYTYVVDDSTHAGALYKTVPSGKSGVVPKCTCTGTNKGSGALTVTIKKPSGSDDAPDVETSWKSDGTTATLKWSATSLT